MQNLEIKYKKPHWPVQGGRGLKTLGLLVVTAWLRRTHIRKIPENFFARGRCSRQQHRCGEVFRTKRVLPGREKQCGGQPREGSPAAQMKKLD
jgi:hypothetical protein